MIHTLISDCYLYKVARNRQHYLTAIEKRRAVLLASGISLCVTIASVIFLIYK